MSTGRSRFPAGSKIYDCSRAPEEERAGMDNGRVWIESMAGTLERLDRACTGR
jgi:hypothetical protein